MLFPDGALRQAAALPVRDGAVCLVTSRNGKRWVAPKGCLEPGKTAAEIALQEAWEEAGLAGVSTPTPSAATSTRRMGWSVTFWSS